MNKIKNALKMSCLAAVLGAIVWAKPPSGLSCSDIYIMCKEDYPTGVPCYDYYLRCMELYGP